MFPLTGYFGTGGWLFVLGFWAFWCYLTLIDALNKKNFDARILKKYHKAWSDDIGREVMLGMKFRKIFKNLNDKQINKYIEKLNNKKTIDVINKHGDIDYPSKLIMPLIKKTPSLLKILLHYKNQKPTLV